MTENKSKLENLSKNELEGKALEQAGDIFYSMSKGKPKEEIWDYAENYQNMVAEYDNRETRDSRQRERMQGLYNEIITYLLDYGKQRYGQGE